MDKNISVKIENIGKQYVISEKSRYLAVRDIVVKAIKVPGNLIKGKKFKKSNTFWALKDVSATVNQGEVVGIIGRNGAGKSTLLKILSRITDPTEGTIEYRGKVASLLEVGTGFHPELTGRENVYLNGSILGMTRVEIESKFDEIVQFSGIADFIDMPVKRYSSGMQVRLAFSVAAHLEADIMIIDEVLAVGDAQFQSKCLGKMNEVTQNTNRTIFFVSHDMGAIRRICSRVLVLKEGRVAYDGNVEDAIGYYLEDIKNVVNQDLAKREDRRGMGRVRFSSISFNNSKQEPVLHAVTNEDIEITLGYVTKPNFNLKNCKVSLTFVDKVGQEVFKCCTSLTYSEMLNLKENNKLTCKIPNLPLSKGDYLIKAGFEVDGVIEDDIDGASMLSVVSGKFFEKTGKNSPSGWEGKGVLVHHSWSVE